MRSPPGVIPDLTDFYKAVVPKETGLVKLFQLKIMDNVQYLKPSLQTRQKRRDKRLDEEVIECYRRGWRTKQMKGYKNKRKRNMYEHASQRESMKFMHGGGSKYFNDNLEPLVRYLESNTRRSWNKVYSELCHRLDKTTVSGVHVFNHIFDFVSEHVWIENKEVYELKFGRKALVISRGKWKSFYVHPQTGLLLMAPGRSKK